MDHGHHRVEFSTRWHELIFSVDTLFEAKTESKWSMDTLNELVTSSRKRALDSCLGCAEGAPGQLAHMGPGGCMSSQPGSQG